MEIVVFIPCYNEGNTISKVIQDFKKELPSARIVVFDNYSKDDTYKKAEEAGAEVLTIKRKGKGLLIQRMLESYKAHIYVIVDGDDTYFAKDVHKLIKAVTEEETDMVVGRRSNVDTLAMRKINRIGNILFSKLFTLFFHFELKDVLSGYRVINNRFASNVPLMKLGFEIESEMTFQALSKGMKIKEVPVDYKSRPEGSFSKLAIYRDGYRIMMTIVTLLRDLRPLLFFTTIALFVWSFALIYGLVIYYAVRKASFFETIVLTSLFIIGWLFVLIGFTLHTVNRRFSELNSLLHRK